MKNRVLFSDNGTLKDITNEMCNYNSTLFNFSYVAGEDAFYYGARLPFNHLYFECDTFNSISASIKIEYWDGQKFVDVVNTVDSTNALNNNGFIDFIPDKDNRWAYEDTEDMTGFELSQVKIYDLYWLKITFDVDLDPVDLRFIGRKFSEDTDLGSEHSDLTKDDSYLKAFGATKTNWNEQHIAAAEIIEDDLIDSGIIDFGEQLLARNQFKRASIKKVAEIVYANLGRDYEDDKQAVRAEYFNRLNKLKPKVDKNADGILSKYEARAKTRFFSR
jgi:hypothetical protein